MMEDPNPCKTMIDCYATSLDVLPIPFEILHRYGKEYTKNAKIDAARDQQCYRNAFLYADEHEGMTYVEGYAQPDGLIPISHAWCVDSEGVIHDPTWDHGVHYFGVPFDLMFVQGVIFRTGHYSVFEHLFMWKQPAEEVRSTLIENLIR
jgi:hypothetical protein